MARKRMIDPEIWTDERFAFLTEGEQLFFIAIFTQSDDEGRLEWSAVRFKLRCAPASEKSLNTFEERKDKIVSVGLAHQYEVNGRVFLLLPGWFKNQKLERGAVSKIPDPPDLSTNPVLSDYLCHLLRVREWHDKRLKSSDGQKMSENVRKRPLEEKGREEKEDRLSAERPKKNREEDGGPTFESLEPDVQAFVANAGSENKSGTVTKSREANIRRELLALKDEFGPVFPAALREINRRGIANANYLRQIMESAKKRPATPNKPGLRVITAEELEAMP